MACSTTWDCGGSCEPLRGSLPRPLSLPRIPLCNLALCHGTIRPALARDGAGVAPSWVGTRTWRLRQHAECPSGARRWSPRASWRRLALAALAQDDAKECRAQTPSRRPTSEASLPTTAKAPMPTRRAAEANKKPATTERRGRRSGGSLPSSFPARPTASSALRYRGIIVPKFMMNLFGDGGATVYVHAFGPEFAIRKGRLRVRPQRVVGRLLHGRHAVQSELRSGERMGRSSRATSTSST